MAKKISINIVIPVYNEQNDLEGSINKLLDFCKSQMNDINWVITIADNASTDSTYEISKKISNKEPKVKIVHLDKKGRGRAVKQVWSSCDDDIVSYMDVDLSSDLKHLPHLIHAIKNGYDIAIGSRNSRGARVYGRSLLRTITSKCYILLIKLLFWVHFTDAQCGFKAVSRSVVKSLIPYIKDNEWFFDTELLIFAEKSGYKIYEEPVTWTDNPGSTVRVMKTAQGDLDGLWRLLREKPWTRYARK